MHGPVPRLVGPFVVLIAIGWWLSPGGGNLPSALAAGRQSPHSLSQAASFAAQHIVTPTDGGGCGPTDPLACVPDPGTALTDAIKAGLTDWLTSLCQDLTTSLQTVLAWATGSPIDNPAQPDLQNPSPAGLLASTPPADSYGQPVVAQYWGLCRDIADAAFALLVLLAGLEIVASTRVGRSHDGALDGLRRLGLAALLANVSLPAIGLVIDLGNVLCNTAGGVAMPDLQALGLAGSTLQDVILSLAYTVVAVLLVVQLLVRLTLLDLLIIIAPLGLLCWASPRAHHWARLWTQLFVATALQQFLQVLALRVSIDLLTHLPGATDDPVITPLLGCASFLVVLRLPRLLRGSSVLGAVPTLATIASTLAAPAPRPAATTGAQAASAAKGGRP